MDGKELGDLVVPGTIIAGKYAVVRTLGQGGMGVVVEARHLRLGHSVALKILVPPAGGTTNLMSHFEREARAASRLQGPHIARVLDVDTLPDGNPFMVLELLRGRELGDELSERGKLPVREAVGYVLEACVGMAEAHRAGIIHRDLKPSNLFLCDHEGRRTVKVLDFGISKVTGDVAQSVTATSTAFGTPLYMSPEQVRSVKYVDARTDIWSLGVVLYELLAGVAPFAQDTAPAVLVSICVDTPVPLVERRDDVPRGLSDAVMKALQKDPAARYPDICAFAAAIAPYGPPRDDPAMRLVVSELLAGRGEMPSLSATALDRARGAGGSRRWRVLVVSAVLGVGFGVIVAILIGVLRPSRPPGPIAPAAPIGVDSAAKGAMAATSAGPSSDAPKPPPQPTEAQSPPPQVSASLRPTAAVSASSGARPPLPTKPSASPVSSVPTPPPVRSVKDPDYL